MLEDGISALAAAAPTAAAPLMTLDRRFCIDKCST